MDTDLSALNKNGITAHINAENVTEAIQRRVADIYRAQQQSIQKAGYLNSDLLRGIKRGESIYKLFLQAVEIIGLLTGDTTMHSQASEDIKAIYGMGFLEPYPVQMELDEIRQRLSKLSEAIKQPGQPDDTLKRIYSAIEYHRQREMQIENLMQPSDTRQIQKNGL